MIYDYSRSFSSNSLFCFSAFIVIIAILSNNENKAMLKIHAITSIVLTRFLASSFLIILSIAMMVMIGKKTMPTIANTNRIFLSAIGINTFEYLSIKRSFIHRTMYPLALFFNILIMLRSVISDFYLNYFLLRNILQACHNLFSFQFLG